MHFNDKWYYFPVNARTNTPIKGWQEKSTNDINKLKEWRTKWTDCLFGIDTGKSNLVVVDIDNKNGKDGSSAFSGLQFENGMVDTTFKVKTPSGGFHLYFEGKTKNRVGLVTGVDIRSVGGYVVAPGCKKANGEYVIVEDDTNISTPPGWLIEKIGRPNERQSLSHVPLVELDQPENINDAIRFLVDRAKSAEEGSRDSTCYSVACIVRDYGISKDLAKELMEMHYSDKVEFSDSFELETMLSKVDSAYATANDRPGNATREASAMTAATAFGLEIDEDFEPVPEKTGWTHISDFIGTPAPERKWIIEDWIPEGFSAPTLVTGDGGTGKSQLIMQLAIAVANGTPWLGMEVLSKQKVALVMCEDSEEELHRRIENINNKSPLGLMDIKDSEIYFDSRVGKDCVLAREENGVIKDGPFMKELEKNLTALGPDKKLLCIDTAADIYAGSESNRPLVNQFVKYKLCGLAQRHNATVFLLAHPPKSGHTYSGSTAWNNSFRNRLFLAWQDAENKNDWRILTREKSNYAKAGARILMQWTNGIFNEKNEANVEMIVEDIVYLAIRKQYLSNKHLREPVFFSMRANANRCVWKQQICNPKTGKRVPPKEIQNAVRRLIYSDRVEEVKNRGHGNGLIPLEENGI